VRALPGRSVRVYVPTTLPALADPDGLRPATAHAVTPELAAALPGEDEEGLEFAALLAAADESVGLLAADPTAPRRRVVAAADVPGPSRRPRAPDPDRLPSAVEPPSLVPWSWVVSLHVDGEDAAQDVAGAAEGDTAALDRAADRALLWYDVGELDVLRGR
jgi:hypothetical protein